MTLPLSMKCFHPVFEVCVLIEHKADPIVERKQTEAENFDITVEDEWAVDALLNHSRQHNISKYIVS